jgi:hypothetical protein
VVRLHLLLSSRRAPRLSARWEISADHNIAPVLSHFTASIGMNYSRPADIQTLYLMASLIGGFLTVIS